MSFFSTNRSPTQKVSKVYLQREDLPVQLSTIWPVLSSVGVHQNLETSSSCSQGERGVRLIAYIDDTLILAESRDLIQDQVTGMLYLLECLGFIVNRKKSTLNPTQVIEFLGLSVDSIAMELRLPLIKMKHI